MSDTVAAPSPAVPHDLPPELGADLGWLLGQTFHGFLTLCQQVSSDFPAGLRGLHVLRAAAGQARNQLEIANLLSIDRSVMVRIIDELERSGLVVRCPDPADRRARLLAPTDVGRERLIETDEQIARIEAQLLAPLADGGSALTTALQQVVAALHSTDADFGAACKALDPYAGGVASDPTC
ncbi:MAG: MarR family winged helix-turn-helix transcriptional regulator [Frankia sp.]